VQGQSLISDFVGGSCRDILKLLKDTYVRDVFGCVKYYGEGYFPSSNNDSLVSLPLRPGVGVIVSCLDHADRANAWEYAEDVCPDVCACGDGGTAFGCLNTGGCCTAVRELLLLYTNALGVICIVRALHDAL
jgi:hypothetical protein